MGGYRYSTLPALPDPHYPGYTPPPTTMPVVSTAADSSSSRPKNSVVGLISVAQLTLGTLFSDLSLMTEVYNLVRIGDR